MTDEPVETGDEVQGEDASRSSTPDPEEPPFELPGSGRLLRGSDLLTADEASRSLAQAEGRLVVWAGERRSGKTTLSAELYERHRRGIAYTRFAGSRTLLGFEERAHPARARSGRVEPHTPRTESDPEGRELLHLAVCTDAHDPTHLVFADIPGELFRRLRDNEISATELPLLQRADKLAIVIDGERIADPARRAVVVNNARQLIDRLAAGGLPNPRTDLMLLTTKLDLIRAAGDAASSYWAPREEALLERLRAMDPSVARLQTSARGSHPSNDGMDDLMRWLLKPPKDIDDVPLPAMPRPPARLDRLRMPKGLR